METTRPQFRETASPRSGGRRRRARRAGVVGWLAAALAAVVLAPPAQDARAQDAQAVVRGVQQRYDATGDYSARFRQTTEYRTLNRRIEGKGRVYFSKPGRMLWRYDEPAGQFVLSDGRHLYFYQPAERQVIKTAFGSAFRSDLPLSFLLGIGDLTRDFRAELAEGSGDAHVLELSPRKPDTGVREVRLSVDPGAHDIRQVRIEDAAGNRWTFRFDDIRRGAGLDPSLFRLKAPEGVDIVEFGS